jgi:hypothetical protein
MSKKFGIEQIEIYIKNKCIYSYIDEIRIYALQAADKSGIYDINALYIIEISALLVKINKHDIYHILNVLCFNHKFINIIIQTINNVSVENKLQVFTYKAMDLMTDFPAIQYVQAGLNIWKKKNPHILF